MTDCSYTSVQTAIHSALLTDWRFKEGTEMKFMSFGIWRWVVGWAVIDVLKDRGAFMFRVKNHLDCLTSKSVPRSGITHPTTQCYVSEGLSLQQHLCENFKCRKETVHFLGGGNKNFNLRVKHPVLKHEQTSKPMDYQHFLKMLSILQNVPLCFE